MFSGSHTRLLVVACVMAIGGTAGAGQTIYVSPLGRHVPNYGDWLNAATNIQAACDVAVDGDTVLVTGGTYEVSAPVVVTNAVTIQGVDGPQATILSSPSLDRCVTLAASNALMDGFAIRCGDAWKGITAVATNTVAGLAVIAGDGASTLLEGQLVNYDIRPGSLSVYGGGWTFTDNGNGTLSGTLGALGSIQYDTGRLILDFQTIAPDPGFPFYADYQWLSGSGRLAAATHLVTGESMGYGDGSSTLMEGTTANRNVNPGTFTAGGGGWTFVDNGDGSLSGTLGAIGIVDYENGEWTIDFMGMAPDLGLEFSVSYQWMSPSGGGGVFLADGAELRNCRVSGFWAEHGGGVNCSGRTVVADCDLSGNLALYHGGGIQCSTGTVVRGGSIASNESRMAGGGAALGVISNCVVYGNRACGDGGGLWGSSARLCIISSNSASVNGGGAFGCSLENCLVIGNSAGGGGGGAYGGAVSNCTVVGNSAVASAGGGTRDSVVVNSILWSNGVGSNSVGGTMSYSCAAKVSGGMGNITNYPGFMDYAGGNLRLVGTSMCINAGNNSVAAGLTDIDGNSRIRAAVVDMGAYESPYAPIDASAGARGWISPSGRVGVLIGEGAAFGIGPNPPHVIQDVSIDGVGVGPVAYYEFVNVVTGHTIVASFSGHTDLGPYSISQAGRSDNGGATLSWTMTNGWFYTVQQTSNLIHAAWSNVPANENIYGLGRVVVTNDHGTSSSVFYRIKAIEAP